VSWSDLKKFQENCGKKIIVDVVLNHTANDSSWLTDPEYENSIYTEKTAPMLKTAIMWD
jgi:glycosidase